MVGSDGFCSSCSVAYSTEMMTMRFDYDIGRKAVDIGTDTDIVKVWNLLLCEPNRPPPAW